MASAGARAAAAPEVAPEAPAAAADAAAAAVPREDLSRQRSMPRPAAPPPGRAGAKTALALPPAQSRG